QHRTAGQGEVAGVDLEARLRTGDRELDRLGDVGGLRLDLDGDVVGDDEGVADRLTEQDDGNVDDDLLAEHDGDEVDVLDDPADRVDLDLLGQRELLLAVDGQVEQRVRATALERHHRVVVGQGHVRGGVAVFVDNGGNLVLTAQATRGALAELGA